METINIQCATTEDAANIAAAAKDIWNEHYGALLGQDQIDYMLATFQSAAAIKEQLRDGYRYVVAKDDGRIVGYCSVRDEGDALFLSKLYVRKEYRQKGIGRSLSSFAAGERPTVRLTVNKYNDQSIQAYERLGFVNVGAVVTDIGGGFVMDDFIMEKTTT